MKKQVVVGAGAGYAGDRIEPAVELVKSAGLDYIVFECLAERTIGVDQLSRFKDPDLGYSPMLSRRMEAVLPWCVKNKVRLLTNMGSANPLAAARKTIETAGSLGLKKLKVAILTGDDVLSDVMALNPIVLETGKTLKDSFSQVISANAYLGTEEILPAVESGADVVITGRVADPSLFVAPLLYEFNWSLDDWDTLGSTTLVAHLLECAGQLTGGYFLDADKKSINDPHLLGFPFAIVSPDGSAILTKLPTSSGRIDLATVREQFLYEIHDPSSYLTPDVSADFLTAGLETAGKDRVFVKGARGSRRPDELKVSIGYHDGFIGEATITYAGSDSCDRVELAGEIIKNRLALTKAPCREIRYDVLGVNALHQGLAPSSRPYEVTLRVAAKTDTAREAQAIVNEVEALYTNGPAGGGGATKSVREVVAVASTFIHRGLIKTDVQIREL